MKIQNRGVIVIIICVLTSHFAAISSTDSTPFISKHKPAELVPPIDSYHSQSSH
ncbi:MAG: hypothetical protein ACFFAE_06350 [Candidatus Hodarchaeota archaeon]